MNATDIIGYAVDAELFCVDCANYSDEHGQDSVIDQGYPVFALPDELDRTCDHCWNELGE